MISVHVTTIFEQKGYTVSNEYEWYLENDAFNP